MGADNWTQCPRCRDKITDKWVSENERIAALYGAVDMHEFLRLKDDLGEKPTTDDLQETLREDYEFYGAEGGWLNVEYRCSCSVCGLAHKFEYNDEFYKTKS